MIAAGYPRLRPFLFFAALLASPLLASAADDASPAGQARDAAAKGVAAYLATNYQAALPALEKARDGGAATGALLYMLGYCYDAVNHDAAASAKAYADATTALEKETAGQHPSLESFFYLSNLRINRGDAEASKAIAEQGVTAIEKGRVKVGKDGTSLFRAGKLYADAGKAERATDYNRKAVAAFSKEPSPPPEYLRRSLESLARAGDVKLDPVVAADTWKRLVAQNPEMPTGPWNLALANLRAGRYAEARDGFDKLRSGRSDSAQDAFYAWSLANAALELTAAGGKVPEKGPDRKPIAGLAPQALDDAITASAKRSGEILSAPVKEGDYEVRPAEGGDKRIFPGRDLGRKINDEHGLFLALVIELAGRGESLQTKSFQGGYAPLVIKRWLVLWRTNHRDLVEKYSPAPPSGEGEAPAPSHR